MTSGRQLAGSAAEDLAARYLEGEGLAIVDRNARCRAGEIVEVRLRASAAFGGAVASVDAHRQRRILQARAALSRRAGGQPLPVRRRRARSPRPHAHRVDSRCFQA
ncbi:MAG TPA: YraN family protein [Burkholderiales bacterium]|nr:YraN family protein [Burkholderiales bacterium]